MNEKKPCDFCKGTGIEPGHTDCAWCDSTGVLGGLSPAPVPPAVPAAWDDKALELAGKAYQQINAYAHRDRGYLVSVIQCSIISGMKFSQPQLPAASEGTPIAEDVAAQLERTDWTPEQALKWYAEGKHFDVVAGRTRITDTGHVASNALKHLSAEYLEHKGDAQLHELQQRLAEAEKKIDDAADLLRRAKQMIPVLQYNWHANTDALLASPGCADGEKAQ